MLFSLKWMNAIKKFATSFSFLTLHVVNLLLPKKILSLAPFKINPVDRPSTLPTVFLMIRLGFPTKWGNWRSPCKRKSLKFSILFDIIPLKKVSLTLPWSHPHIGKKRYPYSFYKFYQKICLWRIYLATKSWLIWKSLSELNPLIQISVQQDYLPELYPIIELNLYEKLWVWRRIPAKSKKNNQFSLPK